MEQAILAQACPARHHTAVFARYSMAALLAGAVGALGAAALGLLSLGEPGDAAVAMYAVLSVVIMVLFWRLTPAAERDGDLTVLPEPSRPAGEARRPSPLVCTLAGLFAIDAFAGGLAVQAVLALWFQQRFGVADTQLGVLPGAGWLAGFAADRSRVRSGPSPTMPNQASRGDPVRRTPSEPWSRPRAVAIAIPCA